MLFAQRLPDSVPKLGQTVLVQYASAYNDRVSVYVYHGPNEWQSQDNDDEYRLSDRYIRWWIDLNDVVGHILS